MTYLRNLAIVALYSLAALILPGCRPDVRHEEWNCQKGSQAESVEVLGDRVFIQPAQGGSWHDLVYVQADWFKKPPVTFQALRSTFGEPADEWKDNGRPWARYELPEGTLQFGLRAESSGGLVHTAWILTLDLRSPERVSAVLKPSVLQCAKRALEDGRTIKISGGEELRGVSLSLNDSLVTDWTWGRLKSDPIFLPEGHPSGASP